MPGPSLAPRRLARLWAALALVLLGAFLWTLVVRSAPDRTPAPASPTAEPPRPPGSPQVALEAATAAHRPVLVEFEAPW